MNSLRFRGSYKKTIIAERNACYSNAKELCHYNSGIFCNTPSLKGIAFPSKLRNSAVTPDQRAASAKSFLASVCFNMWEWGFGGAVAPRSSDRRQEWPLVPRRLWGRDYLP
jgi:hypothetical protein